METFPGEARVIDRFDDGIGWIAHPDETMQRASHALSTPTGLWLVDPVDCPGLDDLLAEYGDVAGVVVLLNRHRRDAATLARRHDTSVWVPAFADTLADEIEAPVERFRRELANTGYVARELIDRRFWKEAVLYHEDRELLIVPEALGTASYFRTGDRAVGIHPMLRVWPPRTVGRFRPDRLLVGHGTGVDEDAATHIREALDGARRRIPKLAVETLRSTLS